ncbi:MarR family winged helix-turn-helix transcriptional regulator [Imhoffiella purpurea]|uniref:MarR family winged helix-turn-helix transcriptional regulator n=1 Tax=Imhoffiella purpurea TaxID=1249627 RepID=UPI00069486AB|nr:MarR family transcriptional regulator [Imhoffiella purpurea]
MSEERRELERLLTSGIVRLSRVYRKEVNRQLASYGISDAQAVPVLTIARCGGGMRQNELAEEIGIVGPSLVRLLDQLCAHGLVERRDDVSDRRAKRLHLTSDGEALAARVEEALAEIRGSLLSPASDADLQVTLRVLAVLNEELAARAEDSRAER